MLDTDLAEKLKYKVVTQRNLYVQLFVGRIREALPLAIKWEGVEETAIDALKCEVLLRSNEYPVIGQAANGKIMLLGVTRNHQSVQNVSLYPVVYPLTKKDIVFYIPEYLIPATAQEITALDDYTTGNFVVLHNKLINYINDNQIIEHYAERLGELIGSRYSLTMQAKILTVITGDLNDQSIENFITNLYNGVPFTTISKSFDVEDNIIRIQNSELAQNLVELKNEFENDLSEFLNLIGLDSIGVSKKSGVSDAEIKSNNAFSTLNNNIYTGARNRDFIGLNKRFNLRLHATFNDLKKK